MLRSHYHVVDVHKAAPLRKASTWGVMSGTLDLIQRCYVGDVIRNRVLYFNPKTIDKLDRLSLPMRFRGTPIELALEAGKLRVAVQADSVNRSVKGRSRRDGPED
jgi:trehalose/maltose hydrolase-like predicted phosphorylase